MAFSDLRDIQIDLGTGAPVIDAATNDAVIIQGVDVIVQDAAIRVKTQAGEIRRQGLDDFGWELHNQIKKDLSLEELIATSRALERVILEDPRITDAKAIPSSNTEGESTVFELTLEIDEQVYNLSLTI